MVSISALKSSDRAEWLKLWDGYLTSYASDLEPSTTDATFARLTTGDSGLNGALARNDDGTAVGLVHWLTHLSTWTTTDYCYLEDLFVAPGVRGTGVGRALIEHVQRWAEQNGSTKVYWLTAETNSVARGLYDQVATRTEFVQYELTLGD
ncbi:MAG TPA: GNAT family N-acetyltransferase [Aeromicrobium sp.]|nr:GNAT family N-acetyltransferase [Aeromicrobium sp.]